MKMKRTLLSAGFCSLMLLAAPAFAAGDAPGKTATTSDNSSAVHANGQATAAQNSSAQQIVAQAVTPIRKVRSDSYFNNLLKQAKGVVIVPHLFKGAIGIGASGGTGVFLAKQSNGQWSDPAFLSLGSISIGPQAGAKEGPVVMLLMTSKAMHDFTQSNNFSLNANAGLTVINYSAKGQGGLGKGDIVVWSGAGGAFAGASVSGADITADTTQDVNYYGKASTTAAIIKGQVHNAEAKVLVNALPA